MHQECAQLRGAANRPSGTVVAILAMRPFVAKEDPMPDYRHHAPSVVLFTEDEHLVLCDWFGVDYPRSERWIDDILDEWNIPNEIPEHRRIDAAVAQILLERVQNELPNWTAGVGDRFVVARPILDRRARRKVELWPRHLMTINWADSGPGFSWPVAYKATYVPGFSRTVVTASADCSESFGGVCDVAIGCFGRDVSFLDGSHDVIVSDWSSQRDHDQPRWAYLFDAGLVSEAEAQVWADEVWGHQSGEKDEDNRG
jgi:hypothetical protein